MKGGRMGYGLKVCCLASVAGAREASSDEQLKEILCPCGNILALRGGRWLEKHREDFHFDPQGMFEYPCPT